MKAKQIALILIPLNIILAYFVFNSIDSEVEFNKQAKERINENIQKLEDLRKLQKEYKKENKAYANNFDSLIDFLENDSITIITYEGETPDTLTDAQALEKGIIRADTTYKLAKHSVFDSNYRKTRNEKYPLNLTTLTNVPHSDELYAINSGKIERGKVTIQVFEISTTYAAVFTGLDIKNKTEEKLNNLLKVGSMDDPTLDGNWDK